MALSQIHVYFSTVLNLTWRSFTLKCSSKTQAENQSPWYGTIDTGRTLDIFPEFDGHTTPIFVRINGFLIAFKTTRKQINTEYDLIY